MAQGRYIFRNVSGQSTEECVRDHLETDYSYQLDLDYCKCVDSFQNGTTIKRLSLKRRPRVAVNNVEKTQTGQWRSAESLSSSGGDDTRLLGMSSTTRGRPPLPPPHCSSSDKTPSRSEGPKGSQILPELKPQPAARSLAPNKQNSMLEKTIVESHHHLEQEVTSHPPPQPSPRRRLASFGGVSSPGSISPFTGLGAYNQDSDTNKAPGTGGDMHAHLRASLGSRGSTGCLGLSPHGSGRTSPVTGLGPVHLQNVRDQMVVALQRLKELEEQVKLIPVLQVKISVLQEEKRQLASQIKNQSDNEELHDANWKTGYIEGSDTENKVNTEEGLENKTDFRRSEEMRLERNISSGYLPAVRGRSYSPLHDMAIKQVTVGDGKNMEINWSETATENKYSCTEQVDTRSMATQVTEDNLGIYTEREAERDAQQLILGSMKERICHLEAELKESALQTEMSRLKLELQAAGARNRADKASYAKPSTASTGTEARPHTTSQGVGNHTDLRDASTGDETEVKTVGIWCCGPELKSVSIGPDLPMSQWEVRERVETSEKGVGMQVLTNSQGVGTEMKVCDAESNTEVPVENLESKKPKIECRSVACGDCSVDVIVCEAKEVVSRGTATDPVRGVDLGIMAAPQTASQRTNTGSSSVSRFTNTRHAFNTDSGTNTVLNTQDKHTNTSQAATRTISVGSWGKDSKCNPETRTVGVGTESLQGNISKQTQETVSKPTRDTGVGFTNINDNFLVGMKSKNMASGPSHLPDPIKTRSIGVGEGRIRDLSVSPGAPGQGLRQQTQSQWDSELNHYIEKMQEILGEHGGLLTEDYAEQREGFVQQDGGRGHASSARNNKAAEHGGAAVQPFDCQPPVNREFQPRSRLSFDPSKCDQANPGVCEEGSVETDVKKMIQMLEQQTSSALQDRNNSGLLRNVVKKQNGEQGCSSTRRSMRFMGVASGLHPVSSYKPSARENSEEEEGRGNRKLSESSPETKQTKLVKGGSNKGLRGRSHAQRRHKLNEKMFSACQALKMHLNDGTASSSRELQDCIQTVQQEWFSVSSHKAAAPDTVEDYLSTFRVISPLILQHVANMADGNGNTALHYSVSHSNFGVVKKLLDAEVCEVNQQNKAGYTAIMLAALAVLSTPEDMTVVERLFTKGDVNAKASQAGQTALMLAVSHGRMDMVQALLTRGAEVNLQDDEGSTALMCASEHGHADMVKLLLAQADCDATLTDSDESTALSIALEAGHNDIAVLLYAHTNFSRGQTAAAAHHGGRSLSSSGGRSAFE